MRVRGATYPLPLLALIGRQFAVAPASHPSSEYSTSTSTSTSISTSTPDLHSHSIPSPSSSTLTTTSSTQPFAARRAAVALAARVLSKYDSDLAESTNIDDIHSNNTNDYSSMVSPKTIASAAIRKAARDPSLAQTIVRTGALSSLAADVDYNLAVHDVRNDGGNSDDLSADWIAAAAASVSAAAGVAVAAGSPQDVVSGGWVARAVQLLAAERAFQRAKGIDGGGSGSGVGPAAVAAVELLSSLADSAAEWRIAGPLIDAGGWLLAEACVGLPASFPPSPPQEDDVSYALPEVLESVSSSNGRNDTPGAHAIGQEQLHSIGDSLTEADEQQQDKKEPEKGDKTKLRRVVGSVAAVPGGALAAARLCAALCAHPDARDARALRLLEVCCNTCVCTAATTTNTPKASQTFNKLEVASNHICNSDEAWSVATAAARCIEELCRDESLRADVAADVSWLRRLGAWGSNPKAPRELRLAVAVALSRLVESDAAAIAVIRALGATVFVKIADVADLDVQGQVERVLERLGSRTDTPAARRVRVVDDNLRVL